MNNIHPAFFHLAIQVGKKGIFEVKYYILGGNKYPYFSTCAAMLDQRRTDFEMAGQCQEDVLKGYPLLLNFFRKYHEHHIKDISPETYQQIVNDLEIIKGKYNFVESSKDIPFSEIVKLSRTK